MSKKSHSPKSKSTFHSFLELILIFISGYRYFYSSLLVKFHISGVRKLRDSVRIGFSFHSGIIRKKAPIMTVSGNFLTPDPYGLDCYTGYPALGCLYQNFCY